jgi:tetratricopeptide (TPR) repeat protein
MSAEQDNVNAAVRWAVARRDADTALRFVRALGYYWVQRGQGEADALAREILALTPPPLNLRLAEARVICALLAAGWNFDIESVRAPLTEGLEALGGLGADFGSVHPLVAFAEPLLLQYDGAIDEAQGYFERHATVRDPWLRALGKIYRSSYAVSLGRLDGAEETCRSGLADLRELGEQWGVAMSLIQLAEFTELRADHADSIAAITEAVAIGRELGVWGDLTYMEGRLAVIHARAGDLERAYAEMGQARRAIEGRGGQVETDRWVTFMGAELATRSGDHAEAARCCEAVLGLVADNEAPWWESLRAQVKARLALARLKQGHRERCAALLGEALDAAAAWSEHPALATVLDACAVYALSRHDAGDSAGQRTGPRTGAAAEQAARLLGAAHAVRGAFDESSLDGPPARAQARETLGPAAFSAVYQSARASSYESALALARELLK